MLYSPAGARSFVFQAAPAEGPDPRSQAVRDVIMARGSGVQQHLCREAQGRTSQPVSLSSCKSRRDVLGQTTTVTPAPTPETRRKLHQSRVFAPEKAMAPGSLRAPGGCDINRVCN